MRKLLCNIGGSKVQLRHISKSMQVADKKKLVKIEIFLAGTLLLEGRPDFFFVCFKGWIWDSEHARGEPY